MREDAGFSEDALARLERAVGERFDAESREALLQQLRWASADASAQPIELVFETGQSAAWAGRGVALEEHPLGDLLMELESCSACGEGLLVVAAERRLDADELVVVGVARCPSCQRMFVGEGAW